MDEPTLDMWRALIAFHARYGRYWKHILVLKWMNGGDEAEPFSAQLRSVRNLLGPGWLQRLRPASLAAAEHRIGHLDRLPIMCATRHLETGEPIVLKRGEVGYWLLPEGLTIEQFNASFSPTPAQIAAMEVGSAFGWDVPGANPAHYDEAGRPVASPGA